METSPAPLPIPSLASGPLGTFALAPGLHGAEEFLVRTLPASPRAEAAARLGTDAARCVELGDQIALQPAGPSGGFGEPALVLQSRGLRPLSSAVAAPLSVREALQLGLCLGGVLARLHARGIVHAALCPDVIWITERFLGARLCAFELSFSDSGTESRGHRDNMERDLRFLAPELWTAACQADRRADLYAVGAILHLALVGRPPFERGDAVDLHHAHSAVEPAPVDRLRPGVPAALARVVSTLLAKDPSERYQSAIGLRFDLEEIQRCLEAGRDEPDALSARDLRDVPARPASLYGRERETQALAAYFDESASPGYALVHGPSGSGKTVLVEQVLEGLASKWIVGRGKCDQRRRFEPFAALRAPLESVLLQAGDAEEARRTVFREALRVQLGGTGDALREILPSLAGWLPAEDSPPPDVSGQAWEARVRTAFHGLFSALAAIGAPAVLAIDDIQWADTASLEILRSLAASEEAVPVRVLYVYREEELERFPELAALVSALVARGALRVAVEPLGPDAMSRMVADCLGSHSHDAGALAAEIYEHSRGNPLFAVEELQALRQDGALVRDPASGRWSWSLDGLSVAAKSHRLPELLAARFARLAASTRVFLSAAACFGRATSTARLAGVVGAPVEETRGVLELAVLNGLLLVDGPDRWRFPHDQIQAAAYDALSPEEREDVHLRIGTMLVEEDAGGDRRAEAVSHLNLASARLRAEGRARWLAVKNLEAARELKRQAAFADADACLRVALSLFEDSWWDDDYDFARELHLEAADTACLAGAAASALDIVEVLRRRASCVDDEVAAIEIAVEACKILDRFADAIDLARIALSRLGVELPRNPSSLRAFAGLLATHARILRLGTPSLASLPAMQAPRAGAAMRLLASIGAASFLTAPALFLSVLDRQLRLSLAWGNAPESAYAFALYAIVLTGPLHLGRLGYETGKVALEVSSHSDRREQPRASMATWVFVMPWTVPLRECLDVYVSGWRAAIEVGDPEYANYHASAYAAFSFHAGPPLNDVCEQLDGMRARVKALGQKRQYAADIYHQAMRNLLRTDGDPLALAGPVYDESTQARAHADAVEMNGHLYLVRCFLAVMFDRPEDLEHLLDGLRRSIKPFDGMVVRAQMLFVDALASLRYRGDAASRLRAAATVVRLRSWARRCPGTFRHKAILLRAELARSAGRWPRAQALYEEAAAAAERSGFRLEAGLAHEGAYSAALARGLQATARHHLGQARRVYADWGAQAKVRDLDVRHLQGEGAGPAPRGGAAREAWSLAPSSLDLVGVLEASQALSEGMELDATVRKILRTAVALAGAQRGILATGEAADLEILALADTRDGEVSVEVFPHEGPRAGFVLPEAAKLLLEEAVRTGRPLFRAVPPGARDGGADGPPRSMLCCPIVHGNERKAVVYLEHRLRRDAFGPEQVEAVRLLSTQAAISLDNARLYARQLRLSQGARRFVPVEFLDLLGKSDVDEVGLSDHVEAEMTILVCDIRGFTATSERMTPEESFAYINRFFAITGPVVREHGGFIIKYMGDGFMALFPGSVDGAAAAALAIPERLSPLEGICTGIGLHTGPVSVGAVGERSRIQGDVMSDVANVACRLESLTRDFDVPIVLSARSRALLSPDLQQRTRSLGQTPVKGRIEAISVYTLE